MRKIYPDFPYTPIQEHWLKVLENRDRGFRPKQTTGNLRNADCDGYCCLGVASELLIRLKKVAAEWVANYNDDAYEEDDETLLPDAEPAGPYDLKMIKVNGEDQEVLPDPIRALMNLRTNDGSPDSDLENKTDYPDGLYTDVVDGRCYDWSPEGLAELNDNGESFLNIAVMIRMFPHFYFDNGGDPTEAIYRTDVFENEFIPTINRARHFT